MVRLAYLITAYDQPDHLARLVTALQGPQARFYVHVDAHVELDPFRTSLAGHPNVWLCEPRVAVNWMGFSQVESILRLMDRAVTDGFDYCVLLSGSDYPIKSNRYINDFFSNAADEFITFWRLRDRPSWQCKIETCYPIDRIPIHGWAKANEASPYWQRLFWGRYYKYRHLLPRRRFPFPMEPYGGSDWWSLSEGCARYILDFIAENPAYTRFYRHTHCPSEMYFHTIVLNSPWANRVHKRHAYEAWSARTSTEAKRAETAMLPEWEFNLRYIDWSPEREYPAVLDARDWPAIQRSPALFARKFSPGTSESLLGKIDAQLLADVTTAGALS